MTDDTPNDMPEKMNLDSMDIAAEKRARLKEVIPEVFAEDKIDFDQLRRVLGDWVDPGKERFGLTWPGKAECMRIVQEPSRATLKPMRDESVNFDKTENVFIEGDNLEVLKLLQKAYFGKIKMIYIDPPYNTGGEFIYPDKFSETLETYLAYTGQTDEDGSKFSTNTDASGRFHSRWLSMMYPRLYTAKNLLREDGVIFVSIDENEIENVKSLLNEIFGEENFVECFVWKKSYGGGPKEKYAVTQHEYILMYSKNIMELAPFWLPYDKKKIERYYKGQDQHFEMRGPFRLKPLEATKSMDSRPNLVYGVPDPDGGEIWPKRQWLWSKERVLKSLALDEVIIVKNGEEKTLNYKQYLKDESGEERGEKPFSVIDGIYTQHGTDNLRELFNDKVVLQFPKPVKLLSILVAIAVSDERSGVVLDFFSGSSTTAQAVLETNAELIANARYIMVQLPEQCEEGSVAFTEGYRTIAEIGRERIRRASSKFSSDKQTGLDLGDKPVLDTGFKSFRLHKSNFRTWDGAVSDEKLAEQIEMHVEHVDMASSQEDLLYEILLKAGFELTVPVERRQMPGGRHVHVVAGGALVVCLEPEVDAAIIDAIAEDDPLQVICLDSAFKGNDQLKANAVQTFKARSQSTETEIVFKTV